MLIHTRRAVGAPQAVARIVVMAIVSGLLLAAAALPVAGIVGIAARDTAKTFNTLAVGKLGAPPVRSVLYDSQGNVITYLYPYDVYRVPVTYDQVAPVMRNAIVAIEDSTFYSQGALDPRGTLRALVHNSGGGGLQGASTLAQQYVKLVKELQAGSNQAAINAAVYPDLRRKIQDLRLAADVEHELTQDQLLAAYLNVAYFDNNAWGIEVASQVYFSEHASQLTLPQAALLAGIVQSPTEYDPVTYPQAATDRRNTVLDRMWQLHYISHAAYIAAAKTPIVLHRSYAPLHTGCTSPQAAQEAFFCDYVEHALQLSYPSVWKDVNNTGGLAIYTTMNLQDQMAAENAANYVQPPNNRGANPGNNADAEVLIQPGTGAVRAIAVNRPYGFGPGQDSIDYAVNTQYGGDPYGVQTGSSAKLFTIVTALEDGDPFGHTISIQNPETIGPFTDCRGNTVFASKFVNAEAPFKGSETWQFAEATAQSVNTYFVNLEKQVGLCNVVKTVVAMGMTRADGTSLLQPDAAMHLPPADDVSSFTLGAVGVSPMNMAAAYATVAAGGVYCAPQAIAKIEVISSGKQLPVDRPACRRVMPAGVAAAANYLFQQVIASGTATGRNIPGHHVAGKTGTANGGYYAAFAGWTPTLVGYASVFNPTNPTGSGAMINANACYRDLGGEQCPGQMYGANAPAATWQETFLHAALGPDVAFPAPPGSYFSLGNGLAAPTTSKSGGKKGGHGGGTGGGTGGGGNGGGGTGGGTGGPPPHAPG